MKTVSISNGALANPYSIRWRLPLSYAGIALLAAVALGSLLVFTLKGHYEELERAYIDFSANAIVLSVEQLYRDRDVLADDALQSASNIFSFLVQARVRLLDTSKQLIADSGMMSDQDTLSLNIFRPPFGEGEMPAEPIKGFEAFLSIQKAWRPPPDDSRDGNQRYPVDLRRAALGGRLLSGILLENEQTNLNVMLPLHERDGSIIGYLELSESPAFGNEIMRDVIEKTVLAGVLAVLIAAGVGWVASRQLYQPILSLAEATRRMAEGDLSTRVTLARRDELGLLARTFNAMAERVDHTVTALQRFVADAAHEINTPITALRTNLELASIGENPAEFRADLARAQVELERLETLTRGLLTLSRLEARGVKPQHEMLDLTALLRQIHERYASRAEQAEVTLTLSAPDAPLLLRANERQMISLLDNLVDNALKFTPAGGVVQLTLEANANALCLNVIDSGIGIPAEDLPKLFSRFHRGRNTAAYPGNGLGLVITKAIVEDHQGQISVSSSGTGTRFTVTLPRAVNERRTA